MRAHCGWLVVLLLATILTSASTPCRAQDAAPKDAPVEKTPLPEIADEPKTVDPATLMPARLAAKVTVDLSNSSLNELVTWLREKQNLTVLLDRNALEAIDILPSEPISDRLQDEPLYLLLDRLSTLKLGWYFENEVVYITSKEVADERSSTVPYNIGDLLDAGYSLDDLNDSIEMLIDVVDKDGATYIGDVMFLRDSDTAHREVQGLLSALRKHGRQTYIFDPPSNLRIRERLKANASVNFNEIPLQTAVKQLAEATGIDIRVDLPSLRDAGIRGREPITLRLEDRPLLTILQAMIMDFDLGWFIRDGVLWVTSSETAESSLRTAVYDVRDLCRDEDESAALLDAITMQAGATTWDEVGGPGSIRFAKPGTMVVKNQEQVLTEIYNLLETYRTALRASKPRDRKGIDPEEVLTIYYRMSAEIAAELPGFLRTEVFPKTWRGEAQSDADAIGTIVHLPSKPTWLALRPTATDDGNEASTQARVAQAVLIVTQKRKAHEKIAEIIQRVENGDHAGSKISGVEGAIGGAGGMGGGMGGFGGGFFSLPPDATPAMGFR